MDSQAITHAIEAEPQVNLVDLIHHPTWKTILLDLVKSSKMDPWDIDVTNLADHYLRRINSMEESNLRVPANAILASAILLKYKSKSLKISSIEDEEELSEEELKEKEKLFLKEGIPYLTPPRLMREGKVSLDSLIESIESILQQTKRKRIIEKNRKAVEFQVPFAVESIEDRLDDVYALVDSMADEENLVLFSRLTSDKQNIEVIHTFLALLFLTSQGKLNMVQDEFFGEIFVSLVSEEAAEESNT